MTGLGLVQSLTVACDAWSSRVITSGAQLRGNPTRMGNPSALGVTMHTPLRHNVRLVRTTIKLCEPASHFQRADRRAARDVRARVEEPARVPPQQRCPLPSGQSGAGANDR